MQNGPSQAAVSVRAVCLDASIASDGVSLHVSCTACNDATRAAVAILVAKALSEAALTFTNTGSIDLNLRVTGEVTDGLVLHLANLETVFTSWARFGGPPD